MERRDLPDLRSMLSTAELERRPSRPPNYAAENCALVELAQALAAAPHDILKKLAEVALKVCDAHSAGLSLLEDGDQKRRFHWRAIAGQWADHTGGGTPRDFGPCGTVLDRNIAMICSHPELDFPYWASIKPVLEEALLIPFYIKGEAVGTIWVASHDISRRFDAEDLRVMNSLGTFAAAAYQSLLSLKATEQAASIVESSDDAIISKNLESIISSWNRGAEQLFGYSSKEVIGKSITILIPPDRLDEEPTILERIRRGERVEHFDTVRRRKDGSLVDISLTISPIKDPDGNIVGASKIARDITERKMAQERQQLLLREMNHRVKNLFAVTGSVMALSVRSAASAKDLAAAFAERLGALARAHELTLPDYIGMERIVPREATLHGLLRTILAPYVEESKDRERFIVTGADLPLGEKAITSLALVMHELATNAAKYGALSIPGGVIHIDCSLEGDKFLLTWKEHDGPSPERPPDKEGFGGVLTRRIVTSQFGGQLSHEWTAKGLIVRLSAVTASLKV